MRVVLDTNVLLSALISPHSVSDTIYRAWLAAKFELITSVKQLDKLRRASRYPKFKDILQPLRVGTMINNLQHVQHAIVLKKDHLITSVELNDPNAKDEKAQYIQEVFIGSEHILGSLHEESYIYVQDVRAASYGYGGYTQEYRYQHS